MKKPVPVTNTGQGGGLANTTNAQMIRTTIIIPATVDLNLEVCRITLSKNGVIYSKNDVIKMALAEFIQRQGRDPNTSPQL